MRPLHSLALIGALLALSTTVSAQNNAAAKPSKPAPAKAGKPAAAPPPAVAAADPEQLMAASLALYGHYDCEFNQVLQVSKNDKHEGYVDVDFAKHKYMMKPVRSTTGALRLEEVSGGMLVVQIPAKSMMMDTKAGRRIVDACLHEEQRKEAATSNSLGMNAPGQVPEAGAAVSPMPQKR
jgi:hypothetical protein